MKNVLIVDDEKEFLLSIKAGLEDYQDQFHVLTATNGKNAVKILESNDVHLLVTDLKMPEMDGFELLAYADTNLPSLPLVVMSAFTTPETEKDLISMGVYNILEKPVDFEELVNSIFTGLGNGTQGGSLRGISLASFLQLIEMEQETCLLEIHDGSNKVGLIYVKEGALQDARCSKKIGEEAVLALLCIKNVRISFSKLPKKRVKKRIKRQLISLIMEGATQKDDAMLAVIGSSETNHMGKKVVDKGDLEVFDPVQISNKQNKNKVTEVTEMALEKHLEDLKEIKGYKAAGIMSFTGEILASDSRDTNIDLNIVGATFNDIFRAAHEASEKIGLQTCKTATIETPIGIIVMCCSGVKAKVHFHIIGILTADGNQALMKMQMDKTIPKVLSELG